MDKPLVIMKYYGRYPDGVKTHPALDIDGKKLPITTIKQVPHGLEVTVTLYSDGYDIVVEEE